MGIADIHARHDAPQVRRGLLDVLQDWVVRAGARTGELLRIFKDSIDVVRGVFVKRTVRNSSGFDLAVDHNFG